MLHFIKLIERTFRMNHKIYPLAYKLSPKQTCTLYYLGFPASWKTTLLNIARKKNPKFKDEYGLPTNALKKLVDSWMEGKGHLCHTLKGRPHSQKTRKRILRYDELGRTCGGSLHG